MDKPMTPAGPNTNPQPDDSRSEQDFGATGVFGVVKPLKPVAGPESAMGAAPAEPGYPAADASKSPSPHVQQPVLKPEPVVHKVIFGGGAAARSPELLDRMRMTSSEKASFRQNSPEKPASPEPMAGGGGDSQGFTQLLGMLQADRSPSSGAVSATFSTSQTRQGQELTGVPQSPGMPASVVAPAQIIQPATPPISQEPATAPAPQGSGGFTELFRATSASGSESGGGQSQPLRSGPSSVDDRAAKSASAPTASMPGAFTQLFSTLGAADAPSTAPIEQGTATSSASVPGSFTRMLSLERQPVSAPTPFASAVDYEEHRPAAGSPDYGDTPQAARSLEQNRDPFAPAPHTESQPLQSAPPASGVGLTRLIRMLDETGTPPRPIETDSLAAPQGAGPGVWTQTFASVGESESPTAQTTKPPKLNSAPPPPQALTPQVAPYGAAPASPSSSAGPSEFTRILDASRMREMTMKSGQAPAAPSAPPPPASPQNYALPAVPVYHVPAVQPATGMPGYAGLHPSAPPAAYPMNYVTPHAGGMAAPAVHMPPTPRMPVVPVLPPIPAPASAAPTTPAQPAVGKLQKYIPLLLIVNGFLFLAVLVLLIFLFLKH